MGKANYFLLSFLLLACSAFSAGEVLSIKNAVQEKLISLDIVGRGGYTGEVISMKIKNLIAKPCTLKLEAGQRLDSKDSVVQDILVTHCDVFTLAPSQTKEMNVWGMCCQAHNHSPQLKSVFLFGSMADSNLVKFARFIDKNNYQNATAQSAVWVLSDGNAMASISTDSKPEVTIRIQDFISRLTGKPIPSYSIEYANDTVRVFSNIARSLKGKIDYHVMHNSLVTFGIYNASGKVIKMMFIEKRHNPGDYSYDYELSILGLPKGTYYGRIRVDDQLQKEIKLEF